MSSVHERFAYQGNGDEKLIDEVYLFVYDREAFYHEATLHGHFGQRKAFGKFSNLMSFPLYQNGQSELYYSDVLGLDPTYTEERGQQTMEAIRLRRTAASAKPHWALQSTIFILGIPIKAIGLLFKAGTSIYHAFAKKEAPAPIQPVGPSYAQQRYDREINALLDWIRANRRVPGHETLCDNAVSTRPQYAHEAAERETALTTEEWIASRTAKAAGAQDTDVSARGAALPVTAPTMQPARHTFDAVQAQSSRHDQQHGLTNKVLVAALKRAQFREAASYIALSHPLDEELVCKFADAWEWNALSDSRSVCWSVSLIKRFQERWEWHSLSRNETLPWSAELIATFTERWDWCALSGNAGIPWTSELIAAYADQWDWEEVSGNTALPFEEALLQRFVDRWEWYVLSENVAIRPTPTLIARFRAHWDWRSLSNNGALHMSDELFELFEDQWDWDQLTAREDITWSVAWIDRYAARVCWPWLSAREDLPWTVALIERFKDRWDWQSLAANAGLPWTKELFNAYADRWVIEATEFGFDGLASNKGCPWTLELIERLQHRLNWKQLSANPGLPWSIELIDRYHDRWDWSKLSENTGLPWSAALIERYRDQWDWGGHEPGLSCNEAVPWTVELVNQFRTDLDTTWLAANCRVPWSVQLVEQFKNELSWNFFSRNEAVPWSMSLIAMYADHLHWGDPGLFSNPAVCLPVLSRSQVIDVMHSSGQRKSDHDNYINSLIRTINQPVR